MTQVDAVMNTQIPPPSIHEGANPLEIREHRKKTLIFTFHLFGKLGYDEGLAGHITVRDPVDKNQFWVNPLGLSFISLKEEDLLKVTHSGEVVEGHGYLNGAAFVIHSKIHQQYPNINAIAHAHSLYGKTWSTIGRLLSPITQDACAFYNCHAIFNSFNGVVLNTEEGQKIADTLANNKALILQNHGLLTVGTTIESAAWWYITMEKCCKAQLLAEAAGSPISIDHDTAMACRKIIGSEETGFFSFKSML